MDTFFLLSTPLIPSGLFREIAAKFLSSLDIENDLCTNVLSCAFDLGLEWIEMASRYLKELLERHLRFDKAISEKVMSAVTYHC